ncbi:MAG: nodulation protein NfeD [Campylobacteraceae bacterium]|jgi:membrane protein implicated in regulation of membrane protease activity|nr:nodulation protein NfeD [Campylobacteraceae bacterium]
MWVLIAGIVILGLEVAVGSFYLLWYGLGLIISGAIGWAIGSENWEMQSAIGFIVGLVLMIAFRKRLAERMLGKKIKDEFLLEEGEGVIKEGSLVEFRGTTWQYDKDKKEVFEINERVIVKPTKTNRVFVKKIV